MPKNESNQSYMLWLVFLLKQSTKYALRRNRIEVKCLDEILEKFYGDIGENMLKEKTRDLLEGQRKLKSILKWQLQLGM